VNRRGSHENHIFYTDRVGILPFFTLNNPLSLFFVVSSIVGCLKNIEIGKVFGYITNGMG
jgi:hypothetical protein